MRYIILKVLIFVRCRASKSLKIRYFIEFYIAKFSNGRMFSKELREIYKRDYNINIGYGSYGGCFASQNIPGGVDFGNYCSIAPNIRIFRANHPQNSFTTHPLLYNPVVGYAPRDMVSRPPLTIGHDVWIGELAIVLPSVNQIGNGAIVGAGSVVTKDVPAYAIVAGNPAKLIRMRFSDDIIEKLEATKWWLWDKNTLIKHIDKLELIASGKA
ncbi:CatB-related O-acetyltransferase [Geofilum rubicundum]|uniref:Acetyltransferase n=1 Tax=Geofilum rubicundum JCM 15548 TaxID=1236989 RepID=A0A0E9M0Z8_9BACT|nr:CatB-related O-acetyltransferase [Geofilum rubicundum]GAO31477.1 acetyltransferase [Geofilum rubicundum JCM 15548]